MPAIPSIIPNPPATAAAVKRRGITELAGVQRHRSEEKTMATQRISIISIPVKDQQAAKRFYSEVLGFEVVRDDPMGPDQRWIQLEPAPGETSITLVTWFPQMAPGSLTGIVLETNNLDEAYALYTARGVALAPIETAPWGRFSTFADLDGNGWVLQEAMPAMTGL
jgi:catechol 2,3-dioxygenase-like lactoylglutathione lyase family enzyme